MKRICMANCRTFEFPSPQTNTTNHHKKMTKTIVTVAAVLTALATQVQAQDLPVGTHYIVGMEGIRGSDLPPPGFYVRDYTYFYTADTLDGSSLNLNFFAFAEAPKFVWMTPWTLFGANYGCDVIVPFVYQNFSSHQLGTGGEFNLGDIYASPFVLSWHFKHFDVATAYGIWAPSGEFDVHSLTSPGKGFWSHMITLGAVWYPDDAKKWAFSLLNRYEISTEQDQTQITPGNMFSTEWAISRTVLPGVDVGVAGYWQQETTQDSGPKATTATALSSVVGVGPEVSVVWEKIGLISSLRYIYEVDAKDRPKGQTFALTLTRRF